MNFIVFSTHWRHLYLGNVLCRFKIDAWRHSDFRAEQIFNLFGKGFATVLASDTNQNLIRSQFIGINFNDIVFLPKVYYPECRIMQADTTSFLCI